MNLELELIVLLVKVFYFSLTLIMAAYLLFRAYKTRLINILLLSIGFFLTLIEWLLFFIEAPLFLQNIFSLVFPIVLVLFVKLTFYRNVHCGFRTIFSLVIIGKILNFILKAQYGFNVPTAIPVTDDLVPYYILHMTVALSSEFIARGWLAFAAYSNLRKLSAYELEPWISKRYEIFAIAASLHALALIPCIFLPIDGTGYDIHPFAVAIGVVQTFEILLFTILLTIAIFMPLRLKKRFNKDFQPRFEDSVLLSEEEILRRLKNEEGIS